MAVQQRASLLERSTTEGDNPVGVSALVDTVHGQRVGLFGNAAQRGGKLHPRLNSGRRPIANKYCEGKMKSTLKRELKVREIVKREAIGASMSGAGGQ